MNWQTIEASPKEGGRVLLWGRRCGHPTDAFQIYLAEFDGERFGSSINGEPMTGWMSVEGDAGYYEDSGAFLERWELIPTHWMPLPEPPA